ncbi:MAG: hypothetical protein KBT21_05485 [Treponema sp.]|nr:hypothetical protein [Candidatus Treponema merdequi]
MIWFFIKKNFWDGWENIGNIVVPNLMTLLVLALILVGYLFGFSFNPISLVLMYIMLIFGIALIIVFESAFGENARAISENETVKFSGYFCEIGKAFRENFKFGLIVGFLIVSAVIGVPLYIHMDSFYGVALGMILLLFVCIVMLAVQWYVPLRSILKMGPKKAFKKCFVVLFDNFAFSIFMELYSLVLLVLSVVCLMTMPGMCGILLARTNGLRFRLLKYDWLDQHPELKVRGVRKNIPWEALLTEEKAMFGKRTFKDLFGLKSDRT